MDIGSVLSDKGALLIVGIIFAGLAILLIFFEKKIASQKKVPEKEVRELNIEEELETLLRQKNLDKTTLPKIRQLALEFFTKEYNLEQNATYEDLYQVFAEKDKPLAAAFVKKMLEYEYSGVEVDSYKVLALLTLFKRIIKEEKNDKSNKNTNQKFNFLKKVFSFLKKKEKIQEQTPPIQQTLKEEEYAIPTFEEVRNLKPVVIKPEVFSAPISKSKKRAFVSEKELNNLNRIKEYVKRTGSLV